MATPGGEGGAPWRKAAGGAAVSAALAAHLFLAAGADAGRAAALGLSGAAAAGPPVAAGSHAQAGAWGGLVGGRRLAQHLEQQPAGDGRGLLEANLHRHAQRPARGGPLAPPSGGAGVVDEEL